MLRQGLSLIVLLAPLSALGAPPVEIELEEDEAPLLPPASKKAAAPESPQQAADALFDELSRQEASSEEPAGSKNEPAAIGPKNEPMVAGPKNEPLPPATKKVAAEAAPLDCHAPRYDLDLFACTGYRSHAGQGDAVVFLGIAGPGRDHHRQERGTGALQLAAEYFVTDHFGLRGALYFTGGDSADVRQGEIFGGGRWFNRLRDLDAGLGAFMVETGLTVHPLPRSTIDPYLGAGVALLTYSQANDRWQQSGASAFANAVLGLNAHVGRFVIGLDLAWFPVEWLRFETDGPPDDGEGRLIKGYDATDGGRYVASFRLGFRF